LVWEVLELSNYMQITQCELLFSVHSFTLCLPVSKLEQPSSVQLVWRFAGELVVDTDILM